MLYEWRHDYVLYFVIKKSRYFEISLEIIIFLIYYELFIKKQKKQ